MLKPALFLLRLLPFFAVITTFLLPLSSYSSIRITELPYPSEGGTCGYFHGHLLLKDDLHQRIERWGQELGDTFYIRPTLLTQGVVILNEEMIDEILRERPDRFRRLSRIKEVFSRAGIDGAFSQEGNLWRSHRTAIVQGLKGSFSLDVVERKAETLVSAIQKSIGQEEGSILVTPLFNKYTTDTISLIAFDFELNSLSGEDQGPFSKMLHEILPLINEKVSAITPSFFKWPFGADRLLEVTQNVRTFLQGRISELREQEGSSNSFLKTCIKNELSENEIIANAFNLFVAAQDTTACTMAWALKYILSEGALENLRLLSEEELEGAVKEATLKSMQRYPVGPVLYHEALEEYTTNTANASGQNIIIPKGAWVILYTGNCQVGKGESINRYRNFGGGRRVCPGMSLAFEEVVKGLAALISNFDMSIEESGVENGVFKFIVMPEGLKINFRNR